MSHSARSAWIETLVFIDFTLSGNGRTPQGVRGLKLHPHDGRELGDKSHSARSAWIETFTTYSNAGISRVALRKECVD